jgi:PAT family acetyl-CoA transporter-like MFS transporter 1
MEVRHRVENKQTVDEQHTGDTPESESDNEMLNTNSSILKRNNWRKDRWNISLLLFLYLLQGIPLGMAASIPLIIQTYGASWSQQATFSFAFWPFSLKLLWAPIVDALYSKRFGRRKTWLIPIQYSIGFVMIILSYYINDILLAPAPTTASAHPRMLKFELTLLEFLI